MSLGKDLATIRNELGFSLEEIQSQIKIPTHTLTTIENDTIFDDEQNKTYTRSFIRSYAKALKIEDDIIVQALDSVEAKLYAPGDLLKDLDLTTPAPLFKPDVLEHETEEAKSKKTEDTSQTPSVVESKVEEPPTVENVNWADLGRKFEIKESAPKIWLAVIIAVVIITLAVLGVVFRSSIFGLFSSSETTPPQPEQEVATNNAPPLLTPVPEDTSDVEDTLTPQEPIISSSANPYFIPMAALDDTITLSVYAAFDKLEPVRVTSDINWRTNPFWMEQGEAFNFDFTDTLLVRGQYSRMLILFNGHIIENPTSQYFNVDFNSLMFTREALNSATFLSTPPDEFPYEIGLPDSLVYRIDF